MPNPQSLDLEEIPVPTDLEMDACPTDSTPRRLLVRVDCLPFSQVSASIYGLLPKSFFLLHHCLLPTANFQMCLPFLLGN